MQCLMECFLVEPTRRKKTECLKRLIRCCCLSCFAGHTDTWRPVISSVFFLKQTKNQKKKKFKHSTWGDRVNGGLSFQSLRSFNKPIGSQSLSKLPLSLKPIGRFLFQLFFVHHSLLHGPNFWSLDDYLFSLCFILLVALIRYYLEQASRQLF